MKRTLFLLALLACAEPQQEQSVPAVTDTPAIAKDSATSSNVISTRTVFFVEASPADLDSLRKQYSEEDYAVVADDGMYYRATAYEYLEKLNLKITRVEGRRPLVFRVNGQPRTYDLRDVEWMDVIVVYDTDREPRLIAPVDVQMAAEYFGIPTSTTEE